jgi:hypothetical protein
MNNLIRIIFKNGSSKRAASLVKIHHFSQTFILSFLRNFTSPEHGTRIYKKEEVETAITTQAVSDEGNTSFCDIYIEPESKCDVTAPARNGTRPQIRGHR